MRTSGRRNLRTRFPTTRPGFSMENVVERLRAALDDLGEDPCFAKHPLRWLGKGVLEADRPLEALATRIDQAEELLDIDSRGASSRSAFRKSIATPFEKLRAILEFASRAGPLAARGNARRADQGFRGQDVLMPWPQSLPRRISPCSRPRRRHRPGTIRYHRMTRRMRSSQARAFEKSPFRILRPAFWRLKRTSCGPATTSNATPYRPPWSMF